MGCEYAQSRGVRAGITVAQATALLDRAVLMRSHEPERDAAALQALARWCLRFTPRVAPVASAGSPGGHGLILDMTGCERLYRGPHRMVEAVLGGLRRMGLTVRAALAPARAGAEALARADRSAVCLVRSVDELHVRLDVLPVEALGLGRDGVDGLNEVGVDRVEQLRAVPREEVVARFGPGVLRRLDLARGDRPCEDIEPVRRWEPPEVAVRFAGPTTRFEAVQGAARQLCERLAERLRDRLRSAASLTLEVERLDRDLRVESVEQTLTLSRPSREGGHLWAMLRPHVERLHLGHGVEALTLRARHAPRVGHTQLGPRNERATDAALAAAEAELVDVLSARLGAHRVVRPVPVATHVPEAAVRWVAAGENAMKKARRQEGTKARSDRGSGEDAAFIFFPSVPACLRASVPSSPRPPWLLDPIEPARVLLLNPEGPVLSLDWRGVTRRLTDSIGPERIAPRWWRGRGRAGTEARRHEGTEEEQGANVEGDKEAREGYPATTAHFDTSCLRAFVPSCLPALSPARDYYRVQDEAGLWLWVFRRLDTGRWFVHGVWV